MLIEAAVTREAGGPFIVASIELAGCAEDELLVRLVATGVCHTDLAMRDLPTLPWPGILGHEGAGIVEQVGAAIAGIVPGDHVVLTTSSCGACVNCRAGQPSWCERFAALNLGGGQRADGSCTHSEHGTPLFGRFFGQSAFATHALVGARNVVPVPRDLPLALLAPLGCGVQTGAGAVLNTLRPPAGSSIAVFGVGAVGLSAVMAARIAGCARIVAIDRRAERLGLALDLGATETILIGDDDGDAELEALVPVDYAVEASGAPAAMERAIEALALNGTVALVGVAFGASVRFDPAHLQGRNLTIRGSVMTGRDAEPQHFIPRLIDHMRAGDLPIERMIRTYGFADIEDAIRAAADGSAIKPVLCFGAAPAGDALRQGRDDGL